MKKKPKILQNTHSEEVVMAFLYETVLYLNKTDLLQYNLQHRHVPIFQYHVLECGWYCEGTILYRNVYYFAMAGVFSNNVRISRF